MNRYDRERPNTGGARAAINYARNTGQLPATWEAWDYWHYLRHEMRRALWGIDGPNAYCGRNERLRRIIDHWRTMPGPKLPQ